MTLSRMKNLSIQENLEIDPQLSEIRDGFRNEK